MICKGPRFLNLLDSDLIMHLDSLYIACAYHVELFLDMVKICSYTCNFLETEFLWKCSKIMGNRSTASTRLSCEHVREIAVMSLLAETYFLSELKAMT